MKFKIILILSILAILTNTNSVFADENDFDITGWTYNSLTEKSDQDSDVKVCKYYYYYDPNKYAFCIEPNQKFVPVNANYIQEQCENENIFNIVKAYEQIGKDNDNYYIAAQLLIWEEVNAISYTFDANDYKEYKQDILDTINPKKKLLSNNETKEIEVYLNEEVFIEEDYSEYDIKCDGIEILENNEKGFRFIVKDLMPIRKEILFRPKDQTNNHSLKLLSESSQDLYYFDGKYEELKPFSIIVNTINDKDSIYYSKKDENGVPIEGAEFTLYELDSEENDAEIVFIQTNKDINLLDALLDDKSLYDDLIIETSERYSKYLEDEIINTNELGYFPYKIYDGTTLVKQGYVFVSDDIEQTNNSYSRIATKRIFRGFSADIDVNCINNLNNQKAYYLCETEPKNGYIYTNKPCTLVDMKTYDNRTIEFVNKKREFTLRLMKESPEEILLDGAKFKISYNIGDSLIEKTFVTGTMQIGRVNGYKYLFYKKDGDTNVERIEFNDEIYENSTISPGKYYYYQSNDEIVNASLLNSNYVYVINGGFDISDIPYFADILIEELEAPKGYAITEAKYKLNPNISYSDITFKNYRVNYLDIIPGKKFIIPKTCIN